MKRNKYVYSLTLVLFVLCLSVSIVYGGENPGHKPVLDECPDIEDGEVPFDNTLYKEWCKKTFKNGKYIYEGYKDIAFNIKYTPESAKTDFWQTPTETARLKRGDCEDAVFLFFSHLPQNTMNAEIVWGWVIDNETKIARAHVWYQLIDKKGNIYVAEGFSNDWNGIIPMEIVKNTETRKPIFTMPHAQASILLSRVERSNSWGVFQELADLHKPSDFIDYGRNDELGYKNSYTGTRIRIPSELHGMSPRLKRQWLYSAKKKARKMEILQSKEIQKIYTELYKLFVRYDMQR